MAGEERKENPRVMWLSLVFLVVFTTLFSLGVVVGKKFIPSDEIASVEKSPGLLERLFSFNLLEKNPGVTEKEIPGDLEEKPEGTEDGINTRDEYFSAIINPDYKYTIQVSSFLSKKVANRTARFYKDKGYPAFIKEYSPSEITTFYRVRIGTFESKEQAREYGNEIKEREGDFKFYVTLND
ncbi:MAG: SPOR domain-containing protein [Candidatus Dadabacteria bacterium]|nr:SPOR domain-containing protein [Candidatus Dadabacteria bacterium]